MSQGNRTRATDVDELSVRLMPITADVSALSVDVMVSAFKSYSALSRPQPMYRPLLAVPISHIIYWNSLSALILRATLSFIQYRRFRMTGRKTTGSPGGAFSIVLGWTHPQRDMRWLH